MQVLLLGSSLVSMAAVLFRSGLFFRNQYAGLPYRYPITWTAEQIKIFGRLQLAIGGCLAVIWLTLLLAVPQLPVSWPFELEQSFLTIELLLLTNAWLVLLVRLNWQNSVLSKCRFRTAFVVIALYWIAVFTALFVTLGWATPTHVHFVIPHGTIA
jgi:hypothetical protein